MGGTWVGVMAQKKDRGILLGPTHAIITVIPENPDKMNNNGFD